MFRRLLLIFVLGLLVCTLATLEFTEMVHLRDNTSNDYTFSTGHGNVDLVKSQNQNQARHSQTRPYFSYLPYFQPAGRVPVRPVYHRVDNLLHSLCVLRT
jgi:hypothetical protein